MKKRSPTIIAIGGREDRDGDKLILKEVAKRIKNILVLTAVASAEPDELYEIYERAFGDLGIEVRRLDIRDRHQALDPKTLLAFKGADGVFFTGGDQLKITSQLADTPTYQAIREIYAMGGVIAGTSAGASVVCSNMLVGHADPKISTIESVQIAAGLAFVEWGIIDQHFAERGRMRRLLCAVSENPSMLGIGIDENTAIVIEGSNDFRVVGSGAIHIVDGRGISYSNITDKATKRTVSIFDIKLHILSSGDSFHIEDRVPTNGLELPRRKKSAKRGRKKQPRSKKSSHVLRMRDHGH